MAAERTVPPSPHDESIYYLLNEDRLFAIADRIDGQLLNGKVPLDIIEQTKGVGNLLLTEGGETPKRAKAYYRDWHGLDLSDEHAAALAEAENKSIAYKGAVAIRTAVQLGSLQRHLFSDHFQTFGYDPKHIPEDLHTSDYEGATWRQARMRVAGGRLATCQNVVLKRGSEPHAPLYRAVEIDDGSTAQELAIVTSYKGIFKTMFTVEPSRQNPALRHLTELTTNDWPQMRKLLSFEAKDKGDLYEHIRAYVLERRLAQDEWAQDKEVAGLTMDLLYAQACRVHETRERYAEKVNDQSMATQETLEDIGKWLGARNPRG